jgi:hypothetical protein
MDIVRNFLAIHHIENDSDLANEILQILPKLALIGRGYFDQSSFDHLLLSDLPGGKKLLSYIKPLVNHKLVSWDGSKWVFQMHPATRAVLMNALEADAGDEFGAQAINYYLNILIEEINSYEESRDLNKLVESFVGLLSQLTANHQIEIIENLNPRLANSIPNKVNILKQRLRECGLDSLANLLTW